MDIKGVSKYSHYRAYQNREMLQGGSKQGYATGCFKEREMLQVVSEHGYATGCLRARICYRVSQSRDLLQDRDMPQDVIKEG